MATSTIVGVEVNAIVADGKATRTISMSLQRHHYRYCAGGTGAALNSLLYASVTDATILAEAVEVGTQIEKLLATKGGYAGVFGKDLTVTSGRVYLIDNGGMDPSVPPNHFFVKSGPELWPAMTQDEFVAAARIRVVEEAIAARRTRGDKIDYTDPKAVNAVRTSSGGAANPVVAAYVAARTALQAVPTADKNLTAVSGRADIVTCTRQIF